MLARRDFLKTAAAGAFCAAAGRTAAPSKPNIIVMMADDMGFSDLGCYGSEIRTPNIDSLATGGVRFTHFHNTARCCPSRASLLTGLYPHQAGVGHMVNPRPLPGYQGDLNRSCVTIAEVLRAGGYQTMASGKWHVTPVTDSKHNWPLQRGFEHYFGIIHGAASYYQPPMLVRDNEKIPAEGADFYLTDKIGENAAAYITAAARKPEPFFLYVPFTSPHWPLHAFESDIARYKGRYAQGWDALRAERHARMIRMGIVDRKWALTPRDPDVPAWKDAADKEWQQRRMEVYAAQIDRMDQNVGKILAALRASGQEENTLLLFLADNGGCAEDQKPGVQTYSIPKTTREGKPVQSGNVPGLMPGADDTFQSYGIGWANASNTPFRLYKHWVHEGGISTPLIARWPKGITRHNAITHQPGHLIDLMATCVDVSGAAYPKQFAGNAIPPMEGRSLVPAFSGKPIVRQDAIYWEHEGNRAVLDGKWKLVSRFPGRWELYDLDADRSELHDLAAQDAPRVTRMSAMYDGWAKRANVVPWDQLPKASNP
jgi:arylsulfatase A-like enzyme